MSSQSSSNFRFTGWHMFAIMAVFFGIIIAVNLSMAFLASSSWTGLIVKNSYVASQQYNDELGQADEQKRLGWYSDIRYDDDGLAVALYDKDNSVLWPNELILNIGRPAYEQDDRTLSLSSDNKGVFRFSEKLPLGTWQVRINAKVNNKQYRRDARLFVSANGKGLVE